MPDEVSLLDQLEEWLEAQIPNNLHELPVKLFESLERISNEIFETLNMHGPPSISIPFPPFTIKQSPPPAPPLPPPTLLSTYTDSVERLVKVHPYYVGAGAALALTVGLGAGVTAYQRGGLQWRGRAGVRAQVSDGMLKEAIVILAPSPMPALLWPLAVSLLRAGYIVIVAVPHVEDAEQLEGRLSGLKEKNALRVLIYNPEDPSTFPPFHRSLLATLTLRFPSTINKGSSDTYYPDPNHLPRIHTYISMYPLNPSPPSQPSPLPALPTLLTPPSTGKPARLITIYPSTSTLVQPDSFANQILTANHQLLGRNLGAFSSARAVSVHVGDIQLPPLASLIIGGGEQLSRRQQASMLLSQASTTKKASIVKEYILGYFSGLYHRLAAYTGIGPAGRDYALFESSFLKLVRADNSWRNTHHFGQYSYLAHFLSRLPSFILPRLLPILPILPPASGPIGESHQVPSYRHAAAKAAESRSHSQPRGPRARTPLSASTTSAHGINSKTTSAASVSSSEHEDGEIDMVSSFHTTETSSSRGNADAGSESSARSHSGLGDSWVGLDDAGI